MQCLTYHQNNVDPFEICNNWIQLNVIFHVIIVFFWKYGNLISASDFSDFMHEMTLAKFHIVCSSVTSPTI